MLHIVTSVINNPLFIEIQYWTFKHFIKGDYKFVVFNHAKDWADYTNFGNTNMKNEITNMCLKYNIECIDIPYEEYQKKTTTYLCDYAMNYITRNYILVHNEPTLIIDSDMFLMSEFDVTKYNDYDMAIVPQDRGHVHYAWNGICFMNTSKLENKHLLDWCGGNIECQSCDVGGALYYYFKQHSNLNMYIIPHLQQNHWTIDQFPAELPNELIEIFNKDIWNRNGCICYEVYDNKFIHYGRGGNWNQEGQDQHKQRTLDLYECVKRILRI